MHVTYPHMLLKNYSESENKLHKANSFQTKTKLCCKVTWWIPLLLWNSLPFVYHVLVYLAANIMICKVLHFFIFEPENDMHNNMVQSFRWVQGLLNKRCVWNLPWSELCVLYRICVRIGIFKQSKDINMPLNGVSLYVRKKQKPKRDSNINAL